jgi:hypothetical protein
VGTRLTNQYCIYEEIKSRLDSRNTCYYPKNNFPPFALQKYKFKVYRNIMLLRVLLNSVPRKIFGPKRKEGKGECRKLRNGELYYLHFSPNVIRVIKCRRKRWVRPVARIGR